MAQVKEYKDSKCYDQQAEFHTDGSVQDYSNSIANALELMQSRTKPSIWSCACRKFM